MMPMVFWASFMPCPMLWMAEETSWSLRKTWLPCVTVKFFVRFSTSIMYRKPRTNPMAGDRMMKLAVLMIPGHTRTHVPPLTSPAPISPPMRAWEELLGRPSHQVIRFQLIAAISAQRITS